MTDDFDDFHDDTPAQVEALLQPNNKRFVLFPIEYAKIWDSYKSNEARFWSAEEIDLAEDLNGLIKCVHYFNTDWNSLPRKDRSTLLQLIASFNLLPSNLVSKLNTLVQCAEARANFGFQIMQCAIHLELFAVMLDMFCNNCKDIVMPQDQLAKTVVSMVSMARKQAWIQSNITDSTHSTFTERLVACAVYYRVCLSTTASFAITLARRNVLPGMVSAVAKVYRDWGCYSAFCVQMLGQMEFSQPKNVQNLVSQLVVIEEAFVDDLIMLCGGHLSMAGSVDPGTMKGFIRFNANSIVSTLAGSEIGVFVIEDNGEWASKCALDLDIEARKDEADESADHRIVMAKVSGNGGDPAERTFDLNEDF